MPAQWTTISVDGKDMWAYMALPDTPGPHPGVVVAQHGAGSGVDDWIQSITRRLAGAGYATITPHLFHREDPDSDDPPTSRIQRFRDEDIVKDMNAAFDLLSRHPSVRGDRIGVTGFCMGGRVTYLMATANPRLKAAGVFYGGNIMAPWGGPPTPFDRTSDINCPVIGFFGEDDSNPSPDDVKRIDAELARHNKVHEFHSYPGAGHSFQWNGTDAFRPEAAIDSWAKLLAWFHKYLRD
jgi:carboxymethylenebutenolidase